MSHLHVPRRAIVDVLTAMRESARLVPHNSGSGISTMIDSSQTNRLMVDAIDHTAGHVQLATSAGEHKPQPWWIRGCDHELSHEAHQAITKAYAKLAELLGRDKLLAKLEARGPRP